MWEVQQVGRNKKNETQKVLFLSFTSKLQKSISIHLNSDLMDVQRIKQFPCGQIMRPPHTFRCQGSFFFSSCKYHLLVPQEFFKYWGKFIQCSSKVQVGFQRHSNDTPVIIFIALSLSLSLTHSLTHSLFHSLMHSLMHSYKFFHPKCSTKGAFIVGC